MQEEETAKVIANLQSQIDQLKVIVTTMTENHQTTAGVLIKLSERLDNQHDQIQRLTSRF